MYFKINRIFEYGLPHPYYHINYTFPNKQELKEIVQLPKITSTLTRRMYAGHRRLKVLNENTFCIWLSGGYVVIVGERNITFFVRSIIKKIEGDLEVLFILTVNNLIIFDYTVFKVCERKVSDIIYFDDKLVCIENGNILRIYTVKRLKEYINDNSNKRFEEKRDTQDEKDIDKVNKTETKERKMKKVKVIRKIKKLKSGEKIVIEEKIVDDQGVIDDNIKKKKLVNEHVEDPHSTNDKQFNEIRNTLYTSDDIKKHNKHSQETIGDKFFDRSRFYNNLLSECLDKPSVTKEKIIKEENVKFEPIHSLAFQKDIYLVRHFKGMQFIIVTNDNLLYKIDIEEQKSIMITKSDGIVGDLKVYKDHIVYMTRSMLVVIDLKNKVKEKVLCTINRFIVNEMITVELKRGAFKYFELRNLQNSKTVQYDEPCEDIDTYKDKLYLLSAKGIYTWNDYRFIPINHLTPFEDFKDTLFGTDENETEYSDEVPDKKYEFVEYDLTEAIEKDVQEIYDIGKKKEPSATLSVKKSGKPKKSGF